MAKLDNRITKPIAVDSRGTYAVVDEAPDGSKAIPVVFVTKKAEGSFGYDGEVDPTTELDNDIKTPIARDAAGVAEVVDEDIDGKKAIPLVVYTKGDDGKLVPAELDVGGGGTPDVNSVGTAQLKDGAVTTVKLAPDAKAPFASKADEAESVDWVDVQGKPSAYPPITSVKMDSAAHADSADSVDWSGVQGKPTDYPPSAHTHTIGQIDGLQSVLDEKIGKSSVINIEPIADPSTATVEDIATIMNDLIAALKM